MKGAVNDILIKCCNEIKDCFVEESEGRRLFIEGNVKVMLGLLCSPSQAMMVNAVGAPAIMKHIEAVWAAHLEAAPQEAAAP